MATCIRVDVGVSTCRCVDVGEATCIRVDVGVATCTCVDVYI